LLSSSSITDSAAAFVANPDMLCTGEAQKFVPHGRLSAAIHPGPLPNQKKQSQASSYPLLNMFRDFTIRDKVCMGELFSWKWVTVFIFQFLHKT